MVEENLGLLLSWRKKKWGWQYLERLQCCGAFSSLM